MAFKNIFKCLLLFTLVTFACAKFEVIPPKDTNAGFRVSGYELSLAETSLASKITNAVKAKNDISIYAVSLKFPASIDVSGVSIFRVYAHSCTALDSDGSVAIRNRGVNGTNAPTVKPPPADTGKTGKKGDAGETGGTGGTVLIYCGNWTSNTTLTVDVMGGKGGKGGVGGNGGDGKVGSKSSNGSCKGGFFKCRGTEGKRGSPSGDGGRGGSAGNGGIGGNGGYVAVVKSELLSTNIILSGGAGGSTGSPGKGGKGGPTFPPFKKITNCRCSSGFCAKCKFKTTTIKARKTSNGSEGSAGSSGKSGVVGTFLSVDNPTKLPKTLVPKKNVMIWLRLLRRYVSDRLLSVEGLNPNSAETQEVVASGLKVLDTVRAGADLLPNNLAASQKQTTDVLGTRLKTGSGYFGRAVLQRTSPNDIKEQLDIEYDYADQVADTVDRAIKEQNLLSVITRATEIALPAKNFYQLERNLWQRRDLMVSAVSRIERQIDSALGDAQTRLANAEGEAIRKEIRGQVNLILSLISAAAGLGNAVSGQNPFAAVSSVIEVGRTVNDIVQSSRSSGCSINDLAALLEKGADLDLRDGFPSNRDFKQNLSKLNRVDLIGIVRNAELESKAAELTSQLACVFSTDGWGTLPAVRAAFDRIFINAAARADLVDSIVDIDAEIVALGVERAGVYQQEAELAALAKNGRGALARAPTIDALTAKYESARESVLQALASLASSFKLVSLVEFNDIIADYARFRLNNNGIVSVAAEHIELVKARVKLLRAFRNRAECLGELPDQRFFFWDMPINNTVRGGVVEPLKSGPKQQFAFQLSWYSDCGMYGRTTPPVRDLPNLKPPFCAPNRVVFNTRMLSMAVELIGGDKSLLPKWRTAVSAFVRQIGRQTFRHTQNSTQSLNTAALFVPLHDVPLDDGTQLEMRSFCSPTTNVNSFVDKPRSCPSPFSTYMLRLGRASDAELDKYLATVTHVRVHLQVSSTSSICLTRNRRRVARILRSKKHK